MRRDFETAMASVYAQRGRSVSAYFDYYADSLFSDSVLSRIRAAECLAESQGEDAARATRLIVRRIGVEDDAGAIYVMAIALGRLGDVSASAPLLKLLSSDERWVRRGAAKAIGAIGGVDILEEIVVMLAAADEHTRAGAALALGMLGYWEKKELLIPLLDDSSDEVRDAAKEAVRRLGGIH